MFNYFCFHNFIRIKALFYDGLCWQSGYTQLMMEHLSTSLCVQVNKELKQCGRPGTGPTLALRQRCLDRLQVWVKDECNTF